jgi:hypothetical protein
MIGILILSLSILLAGALPWSLYSAAASDLPQTKPPMTQPTARMMP